MRQLPFDEIDNLWQEKAGVLPETIPDHLQLMQTTQPSLLCYLMACGSDVLSPQEKQLTLHTGIQIWHVLTASCALSRELTMEELLENQAKNFQMLEYLAGEPEGEFIETVSRIMVNYNQATLLHYVIEKIMEEPAKNEYIKEHNIGIMVIYLKSFIDCIDLAF